MRHVPARFCAAALIFTLAAVAARPCGVDFPWQMLADRARTMRDLPVDSFATMAAHLVSSPRPKLRPQHDQRDADMPNVASEEQRLLDPAGRASVARMRAAPDMAQALAAGAGLPDAVLDYTAGAVAFAHGDLAGAAASFRSALATASHPPVAPQAMWAAFMLGRTLAAAGDRDGAAASFGRTRALVAGGVSDPMELGLASYGEEARLWLRASAFVVRMPGTPAPAATSPLPDDERVGDLETAVDLYAQQATYGRGWGLDSLQLVAEALIVDRAWLDRAARSDLLRQLVVAYALASAGTAPIGNVDQPTDNLQEDELFPNIDAATAATSVLGRVGAALSPVNRNLDDWDGRLAALAYNRGEDDLAERLLENAHGPLAEWVRAKLALRDADDLRAAALFYDKAIAATWSGALGDRVAARLRAEPGVLAMARGDFLQAMSVFNAVGGSDYWGDIAYIAERVLTTDELRRFVARHVPEVPLLPPQRPGVGFRDPYASMVYGEDGSKPFDQPRALRDLLARRLMRDGRIGEAATTFTYADLRREARSLARALDRSRHAFWRTRRARAAWDAAVIERLDGIDLLGTEISPDQQAMGGIWDRGLGPDTAPVFSYPSYVTAAEQRRYDASRPHPDLRFHYRYDAIAEARRAASLLPARSQATAAILCRATGWAFQSHDDELGQQLYRDYVARGAIVPFATHFGYGCPAPDFRAASRLRWHHPLRIAFLSGIAGVLAIMLAAGVATRRRRATSKHP